MNDHDRALVKQAIEDANATHATTPQWCPMCGTRETSKHYDPYCSVICKEAWFRREAFDRR